MILLDQLTKTLIVDAFELGDSRTLTSFFNVVRVHNAGAAFSFLAGAAGWQRWFFVGLGAVAAVFIVWMLRRHGGQRLFCWALSLILGGALGNVIDRLLHGHVVDFIQVHWRDWYFPSFNVADSAITVGAVAADPRRAAAGPPDALTHAFPVTTPGGLSGDQAARTPVGRTSREGRTPAVTGREIRRPPEACAP